MLAGLAAKALLTLLGGLATDLVSGQVKKRSLLTSIGTVQCCRWAIPTEIWALCKS